MENYSSLFTLVVCIIIAVFIGVDARKRGMSSWYALLAFLSLIGLVIYLIVRKPKKEEMSEVVQQQTNTNKFVDILTKNNYKIESRNDLAANGYVIRYNGLEYKINSEKNILSLKLVIPTRIRVIFGLVITMIILSIFAYLMENVTVLFSLLGILIFLVSTYFVDVFYKGYYQNTTNQLNKEIAPLFDEYLAGSDEINEN